MTSHQKSQNQGSTSKNQRNLRPMIQNQQLRFTNTIHSLSLLLQSLSSTSMPSSSNHLLLTGVFIRKFEEKNKKFLEEFFHEIQGRVGKGKIGFWQKFFENIFGQNRNLGKGEKFRDGENISEVKNLANFLFGSGNFWKLKFLGLDEELSNKLKKLTFDVKEKENLITTSPTKGKGKKGYEIFEKFR